MPHDDTLTVFQPLSISELEDINQKIHELIKYKIEMHKTMETNVLMAANQIIHNQYMLDRFGKEYND